MANADSRKLMVDVVARVDSLEKGLAKARRAANDNMGAIEKRGKRMGDRLEADLKGSTARMAGLMKNFGAGLFAGIAAGGVAGIFGQFREASRDIASIGDEARRAGVSARDFQVWKFVAEQNRIGIDQMVDGLKELNLRADEFVQTGGGGGAEAFQRLGYGATDLAEKLQDPSELMLEIIGRLGEMDKAAQIRISDELFGGSAGERFVELLDQGEAGIRRTIDQAQELDVVIRDDVIESAAELDRKFQAITATVGTGLKTAIVEAATALQDFITKFEGMWARYEQRRKTAELGAAVGSVPAGGTIPGAGGPVTVTTPKTDRLPQATWVPPTPPEGGFGNVKTGGGKGTRDAAAEAAKREAERVRELIDELQHELELVGATNLERDIANTLRDAGSAATAEQRGQIVGLVAALHAEEEALKNATEAAAEMREIGRDVLGGMISDLREGKSAADILAGALDNIADRLLNSGLDALFGGGGSGGGFFGSIGKALKIPGFANGTNFAPGGLALVGERGPELVNLPRGSQVMPNLPTMKALKGAGGGGGNISAPVTIHIDATGADAAGLARVQSQVRQLEGKIPAMVVQTVKAARSGRQL